MGNREKTFAKF